MLSCSATFNLNCRNNFEDTCISPVVIYIWSKVIKYFVVLKDFNKYRASFWRVFVNENFERKLSPSRRREAPCEGTNSARLIIPGYVKTKLSSILFMSWTVFDMLRMREYKLCRSDCFSFWMDLFCCFKAIFCFKFR